MKHPTLLLAALFAIFLWGCGSDTPPGTAITPAQSSPGPTIQVANQQVDCSGFEGTTACGSLCVYLLQEEQHCGQCGNACPVGVPCQSGVCSTCPAGSNDCSGTCADLNNDALNCGACGNSCMGAQCISGVCQCPGGGQVCGGACVERDDPAHCGACNNACPALTECIGTACMCAPGLSACNGMCTDTTTDGTNCGTCGNDCSIEGLFCSAGTCTATCPAGTMACGNSCVDVSSSLQHCGACGTTCAAGTTCQGGSCGCPAGEQMCAGQCVNTQSSATNCGACGTACAAGEACAAGACGCAVPGQQACGGSCVDTMSSSVNCGACGVACTAGQTCSVGACTATMTPVGCPAGQEDCMGSCVPAGSCVMTPGGGASPGPNGGAGPGPSGGGTTSGGAGPVVGPDGCPVDTGMITSFEDQTYDLIEQEGRIGLVDTFNDGTGTQTTTIEMDGTDTCNQYVLHTTGSGFSSWGAGVGSVFTGTWDAAANDGEGEYAPPAAGYDGSQYTAISFRAKQGGNQRNPVRFNISVPSSEGTPYGAGNCVDSSDVDNPCWNHVGHFLMDDEALSTQWQTFTFCFDRDFYPMFLPSHLTVAERDSLATQLLKFQFQFNQSFNASTAEQVALADSFDFYLDDIRLTNPASCDGTIFQSTGSASDAFGTPAAIGSCMPVPNAAKFHKAITQAYLRWRTRYVASDGGVIDPDEGNRVVSEAIGYGMLITAAMGDKETFDKIYGWARGRGAPGGLIGWENGSGGSAADADTDIAFALLMAGKQWGGSYAGDGGTAAGAALSGDVQGNLIRGGNQFLSVFNPSYFSPGFYRKFSGWGSVISTTYSTVSSCASSFGGLVPDWCSPEGQAIGAAQTGAQQQAGEVCTDGNAPCLAFESARTPWRLGYDLCFDSQGQSVLSGMVNKLKQTDSTLSNGARIDTIEAGWNSSGPLAEGVGNAMAFIGPLGVAGMGLNDAAMRDRAFRATLDIIERPEFYNTYYQTTLGLLALLTMSGNFPTP